MTCRLDVVVGTSPRWESVPSDSGPRGVGEDCFRLFCLRKAKNIITWVVGDGDNNRLNIYF
ncbi:MAG: hypothetical protein OXH57_09015 [Ekhidna sp.]|nr:hypothetical protein [Ekhidna sp.]